VRERERDLDKKDKYIQNGGATCVHDYHATYVPLTVTQIRDPIVKMQREMKRESMDDAG